MPTDPCAHSTVTQAGQPFPQDYIARTGPAQNQLNSNGEAIILIHTHANISCCQIVESVYGSIYNYIAISCGHDLRDQSEKSRILL